MIKNYSINNNDLIGRGSFSEVYRGTKNNTEYAIKIVNSITSKIKLEVDILKKISHINIIKLYDHFYYDNKLYLVFDRCKHSLEKEINNNYLLINNKRKTAWIRQLLSGILYLHNNKIMHRDIKLQNILLTYDDKIKIIDFGFARYFDMNNLMNTICGSPLYMSPEIFSNNSYDYKSDYWSIGVVCYNILVGKMPYNAKNLIDLTSKIKNIIDIKIPKNIVNLYDSNLIDLVESLLIISKKYRITLDELNVHPFIINKPLSVNIERSNSFDKYFDDIYSTPNELLDSKIIDDYFN